MPRVLWALFMERCAKWVLTFTKNMSIIEEWIKNILYICHTVLLCLVVSMLLEVVFMFMESRWRHVLFFCG